MCVGGGWEEGGLEDGEKFPIRHRENYSPGQH